MLENREIPAEQEKMQLQSVSTRLGKKTVELEGVSTSIDGKLLLHDFSYKLPRDARIGIVGHNGAGKSTLIKLICGALQPDSGSITLGDTVRIGYFSQECESMDPTQRVIEYIRETADRIQTPEGTVTAATMLERFLFTPELQWNRIEKLSGGERKRLYLLKVLMSAPNVLLFDEPTNDLDMTTLTILEDYLRNFAGAVIAISHDRYFLDKMASEIWELSGNGDVHRYNGNYSDYAAQCIPAESAEKAVKSTEKKERTFVGKKKLKFSYREQREFESIDDDIAALEQQIQETEAQLGACTSDYVKLQELSEKKSALETQLEEKKERWVYLNDLAERIANGEPFTAEPVKLIDRISVIGSRIAISDAGVGITMCEAAMKGASLNVFINTKLMKDRELAEDMNFRADKMLAEAAQIEEETFGRVMDAVRP